jgi:beta-N-acetylhexosaminidase
VIVGFTGTAPGEGNTKEIASLLADEIIGGVLLLERNVRSRSQLSHLTAYFRSAATTFVPLICIDNEGGAITRTKSARGFSSWQSAEQMANVALKSSLRDYYRRRAHELSSAGVNVNLAPVVDLNVNPSNPIIGRLGRSYSGEPGVVVKVSREFIRAHRSEGVSTCLKHFPGHGSSLVDPHRGVSRVAGTWQHKELEPFASLIAEGLADAVMTGHLLLPQFSDADGVPASMSRKATTYLRCSLGFRGAIISDDLHMAAVAAFGDDGERAVKAIAAGNDLVILSAFRRPPEGLGVRIHRALAAALQSKRLDGTDVSASISRVTAVTIPRTAIATTCTR